jgi:predicted RNA-binding protein YlxR (DUF448 family)
MGACCFAPLPTMSKQKQPKRPKHVPQRTCIACRQKTDKRRLTRLIRTPEAGIVIDATGKQNGRGAYVCAQPACWDKIINTNLLAQALKSDITTDEKAELNKQRPPIIVA